MELGSEVLLIHLLSYQEIYRVMSQPVMQMIAIKHKGQ
jgi:hypothetical protein